MRTIYSFVVDGGSMFAFQGYYLARSLIKLAADSPADIHVQITPKAAAKTAALFRELGCSVHAIEPFGDGKYCNKLTQFDVLMDAGGERIVLLDTDMICVADPRALIEADALLAKAVDLANPPLETLTRVAQAAGMPALPPTGSTDAGEKLTYLANCNGGFYSIPRPLLSTIRDGWRRWALWMIDHADLLGGAQNHVDQVAFWLAVHMERMPFRTCASNLNYFVHADAPHRYYQPNLPIYFLHYHRRLDVIGRIEPVSLTDVAANKATAIANEMIVGHFENRVFWDLRYEHFPERGSGVGSLGKNLQVKRKWLEAEGIESAESVLDVGCGNLEVIKIFNPRNYLGLDQSDEALATARAARPDWKFQALSAGAGENGIPAADLVLCFEVLIHQETREAYDRVVRFLAEKTRRKLIVSGYAAKKPGAEANPMIFFFESLPDSLRKTGKFSKIEEIGRHTDVVAYRCTV